MGSEARSGPLDEVALAAADQAFAQRGCCCFWVSWPSSPANRRGGGSVWERIRPMASAERGVGGRWLSRALMKMREWSELVAGPRWKTFIRRFRRGGGTPVRRGGGGKFQYDPLSYALNFDEGGHYGGDSDGDGGYRDFSSRFALPPSSAKSSMDLGGRDSPPLFISTPVAAH